MCAGPKMQLTDLKAGLSALTFRLWTFAVPDIRPIRPIDVAATAACELIDFLPMICTGLTRIPDHNLPVGIDVADFRCSFWSPCGHN